MKISVIINTCAAGPKATEVTGSNTTTPHCSRAYALANFIIPIYIHDPNIHEVIVVGEWVDGEGYSYINVPSEFFGAEDALAQRQAGFEAATGDILIFQHDDHIMHPRMTEHLMTEGMDCDVMIPNRRKRYLNSDVPINNGRFDRYIGGHCAVFTREAITFAPWGSIPKKFEWDALHTEMFYDSDFTLKWPVFPCVYDVEVTE